MKMFIDTKWTETDTSIPVLDPYDDVQIDTVPAAGRNEIQSALQSAVKGFEISRKLTVRERAKILYETALLVESDHERFARMISREGSKTIREARKEVSRCVNTLTVSAEESKRLLGETIPYDSFPGGESRVGYFYRFPIGIVLAITPFNDPLNLVAHKIGPAIAAGNSVILKPATVTPLSALMLTEVFLKAGLPPESIQTITGYGSQIGDLLVSDPRIRMISLTGGVEAGEAITRKAGLKKMGMELDSNSPVIVCKDANLPWAVESCVSGSFWAAGQNCIGVQRIYVEQSVYETFKKDFVARTQKYRIGDKQLEETDMGPMITNEEAIRVETWIEEAVETGAVLLTGGKRNRALFEPTVMEKVPQDVKLHNQEVFGPVVNLYPFSKIDEAIREANSLPFGLHAAVFTRSVDSAFRIAYALDCGGVMINDSTDYRLDSMPFGGIKNSGLGREGIKFSLQEMTEPKTLCFHLTP